METAKDLGEGEGHPPVISPRLLFNYWFGATCLAGEKKGAGVKKKSLNSCFFKSTSDLDAMTWSGTATRCMKVYHFSFSYFLGKYSTGNSPIQPRAWADEIISFLSLYDTSIKMPYLTRSAKSSIFTSSNFIPSAMLKGCIHSELFHHSSLIYLLR